MSQSSARESRSDRVHSRLGWLGDALRALIGRARDRQRVVPTKLLAQLQAGRAPLVLDVRSEGEYAKGHVPGARHIPFGEVAERAGELEGPRDQLVVVYCELGPRAGIAKLALEKQGFTNVHYLEGHMCAWRRAGRPLEQPKPAAP